MNVHLTSEEMLSDDLTTVITLDGKGRQVKREALSRLILAGHTQMSAEEQKPRSRAEWHDDVGTVLWWVFHRETGLPFEPPYVGVPGDSDWHDYHTHWTPLPVPSLA